MSEINGLGVDVGTSYLVVARQNEDGTASFVSERDAFFAIEPKTQQQMKLTEKMLSKRGAFILKMENKLYVVGQEAINIANERNLEVSRPLKRGVLSASDIDSFGMLAVVIEALIGKAKVDGEPCTFCFPSDPVDADYNVIYHRNRLSEMFRDLGYNPKGILESEALAYSELMEEELTGVAISCGAGMFNISISYLGEVLDSFSVSRGGDWLDQMVARNFNLPESTIQAEKEDGLDLLGSYDKSTLSGRIKKNLVDFYDELINYVVSMVEFKVKRVTNLPKFNSPVTFVLSGGTSLPNGFLEKFSSNVQQKDFPFKVGEVRKAKNPLNAVAAGCLIYSQMEE